MNITKEDVLRFINKAADVMEENKEYLIELDSASGDGDLGLTMTKGFEAGKAAANAIAEDDLGKLLFKTGTAIAAAAPSTMGTLMGSGFMSAGKALRGKTELAPEDFVAFCAKYYEGIQLRGKANPGERTILDALKPAWDKTAAALQAGTDDPKALAHLAYTAALEGVEATKTMVAEHGKAVVHRAKLNGVPDQGAIVGSLLYKAWDLTLNK